MRGKQTDKETIYKIMISVFSTGNYSETARQLNLPIKTVEQVYKTNIEKEEFAKLHKEKNEEFAETATRIINKAFKRLEKALDDECNDIAVNHLTTAIGTLYDKRALCNGESTNNTDITIKMDKKVEDLSQ